MNNFIFFFRGAEPTDSKIDAECWSTWIQRLRATGHFLEGAPLIDNGKIVTNNGVGVRDFNFNFNENASGFVIVQAKNLEEAVALSKDCPIFANGGNVTIRPIKESYL